MDSARLFLFLYSTHSSPLSFRALKALLPYIWRKNNVMCTARLLLLRGGLGAPPPLLYNAYSLPLLVRRPMVFLAPQRRYSTSSVPPTGGGSDMDDFVRHVERLIPTTFTSISQIARHIPETMMKELSGPQRGGLRFFLSQHSDRFELQQIGSVPVVRRRPTSSSQTPRHTRGSSALQDGRSSPPGDRGMSDVTARVVPLSSTSSSPPPPTEVTELFPSFLVPVKVLWETVEPMKRAAAQQHVLSIIRKHRQRYLTIVNPRSSDDSDKSLCTAYVALQGVALESGENRESVKPEKGPDAALLEFKVEEYEWFRVARLLPTAGVEVKLNPELHDKAAALLPRDRDLLHVLLSAPHLFSIRCVPNGSYPLASLGLLPKSRSTVKENPYNIFVRFCLDSKFAPPGWNDVITESELLRELEKIEEERFSNAHGLSTRQRRRKRTLRRLLQYKRDPSPYFDRRVLVQHLFDLLPTTGGVLKSILLGSLPPVATHTFPPNISTLFSENGHLFRLTPSSFNDFLVQRADDAVVAAEREVQSVSSEEILQQIFNNYSLRWDPDEGTSIIRCLNRLPILARQRLFQMTDVEQSLLALYPDKVEILPHEPNVESMRLDERTMAQLRTVRHRKDFLVPFRFVGEWKQRLQERYAAHQYKEFQKSKRLGRDEKLRKKNLVPKF